MERVRARVGDERGGPGPGVAPFALDPCPHESMTQSKAISVFSTLSALAVVLVASEMRADLEIAST
jgi:hypothetical protein